MFPIKEIAESLSQDKELVQKQEQFKTALIGQNQTPIFDSSNPPTDDEVIANISAIIQVWINQQKRGASIQGFIQKLASLNFNLAASKFYANIFLYLMFKPFSL